MTDAPLLVTADWLQQNLAAVKVLDCTTYMSPQPVGPSKITSGRPDFERGHIPGAQHVDMVADLSDPAGEFPYTLPAPDQIAALLGRLGNSADDHVVLYAATHAMVATRAWYVLRALGHRRLSILDGGLAAWTASGHPLSTAVQQPVAVHYAPAARRAHYASRDDVAACGSDTIVVNALSPEQYAGTGGAHYGRPGRIPGSVNVPAASLLQPDGMTFRPVEEIRETLAAQGVSPERPVITYCGGGIAATVDAFALELTGHRDWAVYDDSLLQWSADERNPMQTGRPG